MVLSGQKHKPPGSVAPWLLHGGKRASARSARGRSFELSQLVVGVGGPDVPEAHMTPDLAARKEALRNRRGILGVSALQA